MKKLPRRLNEVIRRKQLYLDEIRGTLQSSALKLQGELFTRLIEDIIPRLDVKDGVLLETAKNYRLISELDNLYDAFSEKIIEKIFPQIYKGVIGISDISEEYFTLSLRTLPEAFEKIVRGARELITLKLGIRTDKLINGGNLYSALRIRPDALKQLLSRAVASQMNMKEFISAIRDNVIGSEKSGVIDRQFQQFAYDTYQQYDAAYNKKLADEFDMKYFIYQGGLVVDSRDFCVCHEGNVYTTKESEEWRDWIPANGTYPEGYEIKQKDIYARPSYMKYDGYDPLIDRGGYNCRHIIAYISEDYAFKIRPELKKK